MLLQQETSTMRIERALDNQPAPPALPREESNIVRRRAAGSSNGINVYDWDEENQ